MLLEFWIVMIYAAKMFCSGL